MKKNIALITVFSLFLSCNTQEKNNVAETNTPRSEFITVSQTQFESGGMQLAPQQMQSFDEGVKASGKISVEPQYQAQINAILGGFVKQLTVSIGQNVSKGQVVAYVENPEFIDIQKEYLESSEELKYLKSEFERQKMLYEEKISSQKVYLQTESSYKLMFARNKSLEVKLNLLQIDVNQVRQGRFVSQVPLRAPLAGVVTQIQASIGKFVAAEEALMEIIEPSKIVLALAVFEKDAQYIRKDQKVLFRVPESLSSEFYAKVNLVGKSIDATTHTIPVIAELNPEDKQKLVFGMFAEAEVITAATSALAIPVSAVLNEGKEYYIMILDHEKEGDYQFRKVSVKVLKNNRKFMQIEAKELTDQTQILVKGAYDLDDIEE